MIKPKFGSETEEDYVIEKSQAFRSQKKKDLSDIVIKTTPTFH